jgi:PPK2 family polyphosphate:nucleotide phosphotransferase
MFIQLHEVPTTPPKKITKEEIEDEMGDLLKKLRELQTKLYAQNSQSLLIILQGLDAAGKDGVIKHLYTGINPQGCQIKSFKRPTAEETAHDFLWRIHPHIPAKGMIGIFNRSYYEDILVPAVQKNFPQEVLHKRMQHINHFEALLQDEKVTIAKFFLHISDQEQQERINERKTNPDKAWKFEPQDDLNLQQRALFTPIYEQLFEVCNEPEWIILPADSKWYRNYLITKELIKILENMNVAYPTKKYQL